MKRYRVREGSILYYAIITGALGVMITFVGLMNSWDLGLL